MCTGTPEASVKRGSCSGSCGGKGEPQAAVAELEAEKQFEQCHTGTGEAAGSGGEKR